MKEKDFSNKAAIKRVAEKIILGSSKWTKEELQTQQNFPQEIENVLQQQLLKERKHCSEMNFSAINILKKRSGVFFQ